MAEPFRLTDLPFELDVALGDAPGAATLDITLVASADADVDEDSLLQSAEMVELLPHAVGEQLLGSSAPSGSTRASMQVMDKRVSADHRLWHFRLAAQHLPAGLVGIAGGAARADRLRRARRSGGSACGAARVRGRAMPPGCWNRRSGARSGPRPHGPLPSPGATRRASSAA